MGIISSAQKRYGIFMVYLSCDHLFLIHNISENIQKYYFKYGNNSQWSQKGYGIFMVYYGILWNIMVYYGIGVILAAILSKASETEVGVIPLQSTKFVGVYAKPIALSNNNT